MSKSVKLLKAMESYPVNTITVWMKKFFSSRNTETWKYWINHAEKKFPEVPPVILVDLKNEVLKNLDDI